MNNFFHNQYFHLRFLDLLANQKEEIAIRMQKRHEHIVAQMKKELRKEGEKGSKKMDDAQVAYDQAMAVLKAVREARLKQMEKEAQIPERKKGGITAKSQLYDEMKKALMETYKNVEVGFKKYLKQLIDFFVIFYFYVYIVVRLCTLFYICFKCIHSPFF